MDREQKAGSVEREVRAEKEVVLFSLCFAKPALQLVDSEVWGKFDYIIRLLFDAKSDESELRRHMTGAVPAIIYCTRVWLKN